MNAISEKLPALVQEELDAANLVYPAFASLHEGYAVLLEETQEASDAMDYLDSLKKYLWHCIRENERELAVKTAERVERHAIHSAEELIQVAAMARKFQAIGKEEKA